MPTFLYGTAWKEERTASLVAEALNGGFRGIDTANQRRHYQEAGVGAGLSKVLRTGELVREGLFLQSKFTYVEGQDRRLPYDTDAELRVQVRQSLAGSLEHLGVDRLDSFLLHGPRSRWGLSDDDVEVWRAMEELHREGRTRLIGVSNITAGQLETLCELAEVPPAIVQNRCFARTGWDREVREMCDACGVVYQGFSLLTANRAELGRREVARIAAAHQRTVAQVTFRFALQVGMVCLTGTTDSHHMRQDLAVYDFELTGEQMQTIEEL